MLIVSLNLDYKAVRWTREWRVETLALKGCAIWTPSTPSQDWCWKVHRFISVTEASAVSNTLTYSSLTLSSVITMVSHERSRVYGILFDFKNSADVSFNYKNSGKLAVKGFVFFNFWLKFITNSKTSVVHHCQSINIPYIFHKSKN